MNQSILNRRRSALFVYPFFVSYPTSIYNQYQNLQELSFLNVSVWTSPLPLGEKRNLGKRIRENHPVPMSPFVIRRALEMWSGKGDRILDPMCGTGSVLYEALQMGRRALGFDIVPQYIHLAQKRGLKEAQIGDARKLPLGDESVEMILTSPPFWNLWRYEEVSGQIGHYSKLKDYLQAMNEAMAECYRVLKGNHYCVVQMGDVRHRKLFSLSSLIIPIAEQIGFSLWDDVIHQRSILSPVLRRHRAAVKYGYSVRVHTHLLVFKKEK